jgi:hypothetical protein
MAAAHPDRNDVVEEGPHAEAARLAADAPEGCPCCEDVDSFGLSSHMCGGCYRFVCGDCKVDAAGESSPCHGICKDCRAKGLDEGALAIRSLKRIEAELKRGDIEDPATEEIDGLARSIRWHCRTLRYSRS